MANDMKRDIAVGSTAFVIGSIVPALISMNIFARPEMVNNLEVRVYRDFITKVEFQQWTERMDKHTETIEQKIDKLLERNR